jgi:UDP:flavonoid glycosyltransferase YjiC (YdhE family)
MYTSNPSYTGRSKIFDSNKMLQPCFDALANEDYYVVVTTGHHPLPKAVTVPSNFMRLPYVPGLFMAESSDLLIHHGGYGSCQTSLYCGTPSLIFPTFSERESNARRLKALGAAEFILPGRYAVENIREKVKLLLHTPSYSMAAATYGQQLKSFGGITKAVELIEKFTTAPVANDLLQIK